MKKNAIYRFRILNNDFEAHYNNISFVYNCTPSITTQIFCSFVPFVVIGADSALRNIPTKEAATFRVASAERVDLLIRFPENTSTVYLHNFAKSKQDDITFAIMKIDGVDTTQNYFVPSSLPVPFQDLSQLNDTNFKKRMRPLFFFGGLFSINGHVNFHHGQSENPEIGTI